MKMVAYMKAGIKVDRSCEAEFDVGVALCALLAYKVPYIN